MSSARKLRRTAARRRYDRFVRTMEGYEIVYGRLIRYPWQTPEMNARISRLHDLVATAPADAIPELVAAIEQHPGVPVFHNYLCVAYNAAGDSESADRTIVESYRSHPDYLFARLNYAELRIREGDVEGALEALDGRLELRDLYPGRTRFHVSEVVGFTYVVGLYHLETGNRDAARACHEWLLLVAPDDPATASLHRRLHPIRTLFGAIGRRGRP